MKNTIVSSLFMSLLVSSSVFAEEKNNHSQGMGHEDLQQMDSAAMKAIQNNMHAGNALPGDDGQVMQLTDGIVKRVDPNNGKITLQHGEIAKVKMPGMTMSYLVKHVQQLKIIHEGDKVRFALDKLNNGYVVTHIEVAK